MKNKQSTFICHSWLGIGIGDGRIDRIFTASKDEIVKDIETLFLANASKGIADDHIWFSILMRPPRNQFTRCQRVSCCLSTLLCTMLANAMFYQKDKVVGATIDLGSFKFSWTQIMIGIQSAFIVFPINLLIVTLFRRFTARRIAKESEVPMKENHGSFLQIGNVNKNQAKKSLKKDENDDLDFKPNENNRGQGELRHPMDPSNGSDQGAIPVINFSPPDKYSRQALISHLSKSQQSLVNHVGENGDPKHSTSVGSMQDIGTEVVRDRSILLDINKRGNSNGKQAISCFY